MDHAILPSPEPTVRERSPACFSPPPRFAPSPHSQYSPSLLAMAYTQSHQGLAFPYPTLPDNSEVAPYDTEPSTTASRQMYNLSTPEASPPTATQQLAGSPNIRTRAGTQRSAASQGSKLDAVKSGRIEKASPKRKPATIASSPPTTRKDKLNSKPVTDDGKSIQQPLSVLAETWNIPQVDIASYVARPEEERRNEVEKGKVPGKVKRAMNAFMLYRKAYQDIAKKFAQQSNHQIVSKVCGQSWSMEPDAIRRQFNEWAVIERDNHRKAHPEYKFTPSKPKKKGKDGLDDDSDIEVADWDHQAVHYGAGHGHLMMDQHAAQYGYQYSTSHFPDMQSSYAAYHRPQHPISSGLSRHTTSAYDNTDEYASGASHYRQSPAASGHQHQHQHQQQQHQQQQHQQQQHQHQQHQHQQQHQQYQQPHQQQYQQHPLGSHGMSSSHHTSTHQSFGLHGQYPPQVPTLPSQQPLGPLASHSNATQGHSAQHAHTGTNVASQIDPSLMPRNGMAQYDISNPVLGGGTLSDNQWQPNFPPGADNAELYSGPYVADVEESYLPDTHLQYLQSEEDWRVDSTNDAEDWTSTS